MRLLMSGLGGEVGNLVSRGLLLILDFSDELISSASNTDLLSVLIEFESGNVDIIAVHGVYKLQ